MKNNILVLLSSYNGEKYIKEQIDSILNQKTDYEVHLLVRDDGSKDSTRDILENYVAIYPERVHVIYGENKGYIKSFFELIKQADGYKYYALSDQDDVWLENKLQAAVSLCDKENYDQPLLYGSSSFLVNTDLEKFGETQKELRKVTFYNSVIQNIFPGHTQVFNEALRILLSKEIDYSKIYVHDSWITNIAVIYGKTIFDNNSYTLYRQHGSNEVGFGKGTLGWIKERLKRIKKQDNKKYAKQIAYLYKICHQHLEMNEKQQLLNFLTKQKNISSRITFALKMKFYRQKSFENLLFRILYIIGGYKVE